MRLLSVHKLLITVAIAAALLYGLWAVTRRDTGAAGVTAAALAFVFACILGAYLRSFVRRTGRRPTAQQNPADRRKT